MMKVVVLVSLEVILPATMGSSGRDKQVDSVPHERERGCKDKQGRSNTTAEVYGCIQCCTRIQFTSMTPNPSPPVVVEMLYGMHAEAGEGLDVRVPVVERVHVLVQRLRGDTIELELKLMMIETLV